MGFKLAFLNQPLTFPPASENGIVGNMSKHILERRKFLKLLGVSSAGITTAAAFAASREKISDGSEHARQEIERLKEAYENLDGRSKLILRLILAMSGLDILLAF